MVAAQKKQAPSQTSPGKRWVGKKGKPTGAATSAEKVEVEEPATASKGNAAGTSTGRARPKNSSVGPRVHSRALLLQVRHALRPSLPAPGPQDLKSMPVASMPHLSTPPASPREANELEDRKVVEAPKIQEADSTTTSVILMNIPSHYTREMVISLLAKQGFAGIYDFLYLPVDASSNENLGYLVINFLSAEMCSKFVAMFHGTLAQSCFPGTRTGQLCEVRTAAVQGRQANYDRVRLHNSFGLAASAKTAGYDNVASRHLAAEAAAFSAARARAASAKKKSGEDRETMVQKQIEFYFSTGNLGHDEYLRSLMDSEGWIELGQLIKFPRLKTHGVSVPMAAASLVGSTCVEVSSDGKRVRHSNAILREVFHSAPKERPPADAPKHGMAASGLSTEVMESKVRQIGKDEVYF